MTGDEIKALIGTGLFIMLFLYYIKRRFDLAEKRPTPPHDVYDPDEYDRR